MLLCAHRFGWYDLNAGAQALANVTGGPRDPLSSAVPTGASVDVDKLEYTADCVKQWAVHRPVPVQASSV